MFKFFKKKRTSDPAGTWVRRWSPAGIEISESNISNGIRVIGPMIDTYLAQLIDDELAQEAEKIILVSWENVFQILNISAYNELQEIFGIPLFTDARPTLRSSQSLTDENFSIAIGAWRYEDGASFDGEILGALLIDSSSTRLMRPEQWLLFKAVTQFSHRPLSERTDFSHRQSWGGIRTLALKAGARLDDFLYRSVVLTPDTLDIGLRKSEIVSGDKVVEIIPGFADAPLGWLEAFDRAKVVRDRYDIPTSEGIVQVMVTPKVRAVLQEIKRMEHRRVAGARAQAFLTNPYATLGPDATDVILESQFEQARDDAGLTYERFTPAIDRDALGYPQRVSLYIEIADSKGLLSSEIQLLDVKGLEDFVRVLDRAISGRYQLLAWRGFDFEVQGDAQMYLSELSAVLKKWKEAPALVSYAQVHDLSGYSTRIEGIGIEKPYHSPYIAKKNEDEGWFPDNVIPMIVYSPPGGGEPIAVPTNQAAIEKLKKDLVLAQETGKKLLEVTWLENSIAIDEAANIVAAFDKVFSEVASGHTPNLEKGAMASASHGQSRSQTQLILRANIQKVEYEELRIEALQSGSKVPKVPHSVRPEYSLLPHQLEGLAWLQHLYSLQTEYQVRGAILADDMGLGKTFQLLSLMAGLIESNESISPILVVAPVSLLENWAEEATKFFRPGALSILTAYGDGLACLRVPKDQIDERLQTEDKLVKFLIPNWVGNAKIVLTTYETLRDLEFSFAAQKWSLMVCDEAQRIKNPAAMVTRAAKKQNVDFKIACTGTPVENTLADLWCLFDFVQPGLLGALNEFGDRYRKPIEAKSDEEKFRVEELRAKIGSQILRRMKSEVAKDLPPKVIVEDCRKLPLSMNQRNLYSRAVDSFKKRAEPDIVNPFKNHLGLLHYLRLVCVDPRPHGLNVFKPESLPEYRKKAPKLDWLLSMLEGVKVKGEKVIVFCEFREIQRLLQHYIENEFGFRPDIINGDTSASSTHIASRQKRISAFQEKDGFGVIILSPVAVGFGVNIQKANHVVHYTRTWNPAKEDQATDRAYRIGQQKPVYVYYPVVYAEDFTTFDVKLDLLLSYKRQLAEDMLNGAGDISPSEFNIADVVPGGNAEGIDQRINIDIALRMGWQHFECLVGALWAKRGYESYRTPGTNDYGVDVVAIAGRTGQLVQAKSSGVAGNSLNWDAVKEVVAGEAYYKRRHPNVEFEKVCLTNQFFNSHAKENAALNSVELLDQFALAELLEKHPVTMLEVERMLYSEWQ